MKPVYVNKATVDYNPATNAVSIAFYQNYTEHSYLDDGNGAQTDISARLINEEAHVVMSKEVFQSIRRIINALGEKMDEDRDFR